MKLLDAFAYPIRRSGWVMIVAGAIFYTLLELMRFAPLFGFGALVFSSGYFGAYYLEIVGSTMTDSDELPHWPGFSNFTDDIISPFLQIVGVVLLAFGPFLLLDIFGDPDVAWFSSAEIALVIYGCFYFPMAVLALKAFGRLTAALPHVVLPGIFRSLPGYLLSVGALALGVFVCAGGQRFAEHVPYVGWFFTAAIGIYSLMFQGRYIGLVYRERREKLGWE